MDENNSLVYGLEFQARALASRQTESDQVRFFCATQSLKPNNQLHVLDLNEDSCPSLEAKVFSHPLGEVWKLTASPHDGNTLASCYSIHRGTQTTMQTALLRLPDQFESSEEFLQFADVDILKTDGYGGEIRATEFHPTDSALLSTVVDGKVLLFNRAEASTKLVAEINAKHMPKFSGGRWSHFNQGNQFITLFDCSIKSYDVRDPNHCAWTIEDAHSQLVRDLDCNPNKQCHIVTGGDDGVMKIWDFRNTKEHVFARNDHHHWIWNVRYNTYHDQLLLSSSSDGKVLLTCASSVSSETLESGGDNLSDKEQLADGLLQMFDQHEDSVYCVEWSTADPWVFASLSYDGRLVISKVPKQYKYQILL
ncbi:AAEL006724-PA [Aedes aegypti]|uniref:EIPR1-like beta-propeller domain-containing protein n=2 Tax=Aedes aegypti TaxID=7159 RepID=Q174Z6_AEDAE|nr:protein TSSC1 [Aedes aegypti]EAT41635.1 AAEL006724-PA [Aedes aegypti]